MNNMPKKKMSARRRAIRRRNIFLLCSTVILIALVSLIVFLIVKLAGAIGKDTGSSASADSSSGTSDVSSEETPVVNTEPQYVQRGNYTLDATYSRLLLVNGENPLPADYDYEGNLTTIEAKYHTGQLDQIDKDIYPYVKAMCEAAWADGVDLYVWSPYRSYNTQKMLFEQQVQRQINNGVPADQAEDKAATIVARPGASEHHTGLAIDFNCANDSFEGMPAFAWMQEHAAEYGFIMRYAKDKTEITGVIYESWHYRFVGINEAQKIKASGLCLEEYLAQQAK